MEAAQVEPLKVQLAPRLGVSRQKDLKATVELEPVDEVRSHTAADCIGGLEHDGAKALLVQSAGARQPGEACSHDHDVMSALH